VTRLGGGCFPSELPRLLSLMLRESLRFSSWGTEGRLSVSGTRTTETQGPLAGCGASQHPVPSPVSPALCPTSLCSCPPFHQLAVPCSRGCHSPQGVLSVLGPSAAGTSRAPGRRGGTRAVLSITLGSGSSETDWRSSCRRYPKKVLERFSLRSFLRSSLSEVRGAGFGVGGASVLWSSCGW